MNRSHISCVVLGIAGMILADCVVLVNVLEFHNHSGRTIEVFVNHEYPDSSLTSTLSYGYIDPNRWSYIANYSDVRDYPGLTVFVFDRAYVKRLERKHGYRTERYLEADSLLAKYYVPHDVLDSLDWELIYPIPLGWP